MGEEIEGKKKDLLDDRFVPMFVTFSLGFQPHAEGPINRMAQQRQTWAEQCRQFFVNLFESLFLFVVFFSPTLFSIAVAIVAAPLRPLFNQQERDHCRYSQVRITRRKMVCNTFVTDTSFFFYQMMTIYHPYMIVYCYGPSIWDLRSFPNIQRWPSAQPLLCSVQAADSGEEFICFFFLL